MSTSQPEPCSHWLRELAVPALMLVGIGLFVFDSLHLSTIALVLPAALVVVVVVSLLWALASELFGARPAAAAPSAVPDEDDAAPGPILHAKPWLLVLLPALLLALLDYLGALVVLVALVFCAQLVFSTRAPLRSLVVAVAVTLPTYALFKYVLYVRFPAGVLGLG
jgi:hypothetical protein